MDMGEQALAQERRNEMTVYEIKDLLDYTTSYKFIDTNSGDEFYDGENSNEFDECEVIRLYVRSNSLMMEIERPTKMVSVTLSITYAAELNFEIPVGVEPDEAIQDKVLEILLDAPDHIYAHGYCFSEDEDNFHSGEIWDTVEYDF